MRAEWLTADDFAPWDAVEVKLLDGTWCALRPCPACAALVLIRDIDRHIASHRDPA
jgi:hypothetical protein